MRAASIDASPLISLCPLVCACLSASSLWLCPVRPPLTRRFGSACRLALRARWAWVSLATTWGPAPLLCLLTLRGITRCSPSASRALEAQDRASTQGKSFLTARSTSTDSARADSTPARVNSELARDKRRRICRGTGTLMRSERQPYRQDCASASQVEVSPRTLLLTRSFGLLCSSVCASVVHLSELSDSDAGGRALQRRFHL